MDVVELVGEQSAAEMLSDFSCEYAEGLHNNEVEEFLFKSGIEFSKRKISITYLVMNEAGRVAGYFTLTHRPISVPLNAIKSKSGKRKMERHAKCDGNADSYNVSAFLIAQLGKNYNIPPSEQISGKVLMDKALSIIEDIQQQIGGGIVFLECEDKPKLIDFYSKTPNSFFAYNERYSETDGVKYVQLMRFV